MLPASSGVQRLLEILSSSRSMAALAVLMSAGVYESTQRQLKILKILAQGEADIAAGVGYDLDVVMAEADELLDRS